MHRPPPSAIGTAHHRQIQHEEKGEFRPADHTEPGRVVPFLRKADDIAIPTPETIPGAVESTYNQTEGRSRSRWAFTGQVEYVGGAEGERMRTQLAAVLRDLLEWAAEQGRDDDREAA